MLLYTLLYLILSKTAMTHSLRKNSTSSHSSLKFTCTDGSKIDLERVCDGEPHCGDRIDEAEELCQRLRYPGQKISCPALSSTDNVIKRCEIIKGSQKYLVSCDQSVEVETQVYLECPESYDRISGYTNITCLNNGTWSQPPLICKPICGKRDSSATTLIVNGWKYNPTESLPWQATLFSKENGEWKFFCAGTLISNRVVLTAAHCVWKFSESNIRVAFAILSSNITKATEISQIKEVERIETPDAYQDFEGNYNSDLSLIILKMPVTITDFVRPACIDWTSDNVLEKAQENGQIGLAAGFGITENETYSETLRVTSLQVVSNKICRENQQLDFRKYLTFTSFCAGWANGTGVCNGDSGGGLVLQEKNSSTWQVHGVVSISPRKLGTSFCDPQHYTIFTKAASSIALLQETPEVEASSPSTEEVMITQYDGVQITPSFIEFKDACEGVTYRETISIRNIGPKPAYVRIRNTQSIAFQIKSLKRGVMLNPGLTVSTTVVYTYKRPSLLRAVIPIEINGKVIDYRVICTLAFGRITIEPKSIDFGTIDIGYSSRVKVIKISNIGGKSTKFSIDLGKNDLEITVKPMKGVVRPQKEVNLKVELIGLCEGTYYGEFWIKSSPNIRVPLSVNVIVPRFVAYHPNTTGDFTLLDFPPTFENTQKYDTFVLRNLSSQMASYVVLGETGNELQCIRDIDRKVHPVFSAFEIRPAEGRMNPFEGIIFEVKFSPTKELLRWRQQLRQKKQSAPKRIENDYKENDFMAFMRIVRVHCTETKDLLRADQQKEVEESVTTLKTPRYDTAIMDISPFSSARASSVIPGQQDTVRLCLHGEVEAVRLNFQPDALYFDDISVGQTSQRVIRISNLSPFTPVSFSCVPNSFAYCDPDFYQLQPEGSVEALVKVQGKVHLPQVFKIRFDTIVDSFESSPRRRHFELRSASYFVECKVKVLFDTKPEMRTKFVLGITPMITNEVGLHTNQATFNSDIQKPRQAMLSVEKSSERPWANKHLLSANINSDSLPAYPNDTQKSLRKYRGPPVRTIFTGKERYTSGPNHPEELSKNEIIFKEQQKNYWTHYIRSELYTNKSKSLVLKKNVDMDIIKRIIRPPKWKYKNLLETIQCKAPEDLIKQRTLFLKSKHEVLIPLSPIQIYNIHIFPTMFTFGLVAPGSNSYRQLIVENGNDFPVMIRLLNSSSKSISFEEENLMLLPPGSIVAKLLKFHATVIGKFNGYIDYIINDNHTFQLSITADVVNKQLTLNTREVMLGSDWLPEEIYQPIATVVQIKNKLDAKTGFRWEVPSSSGFHLEPQRGNIRGNGMLFVYIHHDPNTSKSTSTEAVMKCEGGTYMTLRLSIPPRKPDIAFINDTIDVGCIALNLPTRTSALLRNFDAVQVLFEIDSFSLVRGCDVQPQKGIIPPCGIFKLEITLTLDACVKFATTIQITFQKGYQLQLKLRGAVLCPRLKLFPEYVEYRRISATAYKCQEITAKNVGKTILKLNFILDDFPEFKISLLPTRGENDIGKNSTIIAPGKSLKFYLHFEPIDLASYVFHLPIIINDIFGPASNDNLKSLNYSQYTKLNEEYYSSFPGFQIEKLFGTFPSILIDCIVVKHIIHFNKLSFNFNIFTNQVNELFKIENRESQRKVNVIIKILEFTKPDSPFSIEWIDGAEPEIEAESITCSLQLGEFSVFKLKFEPKTEEDFIIQAPIFLPDDLGEVMFNRLCLQGENQITFLDTEKPEIYVAPKPLSLPIEEKFRLRAWNFKTSSTVSARPLKYERCSGEYRTCVAIIEFPNGNEINPGPYSEVDVKVIFKSDVPLSVCLIIEFRANGARDPYFLTIYVTTDNSLLTTHTYMRKSTESYRKLWTLDTHSHRPSIPSKHGNETKEELKISFQHHTGTAKRASEYQGLESRVKIHEEKSYFDMDTIDLSDEMDLQNQNPNASLDEKSSDYDFFGSVIRSRKCSGKQLSYPYFPIELRNDDYEIHMKRTMSAAEQWLHSGPFKFKFYPKIPEGITTFLSNQHEIKKMNPLNMKQKGQTITNWSFFHVIASFVGNRFYKHIGYTDALPENDSERAQYVLRMCDKMLGFLLSLGACLSHVSAEFLLSYDDYLLLTDSAGASVQSENIIDADSTSEKSSQQLFEARSKQYWLDVVLQTYKCFVLCRISELPVDRRSTSLSPFSSRRSTMHRESRITSSTSIPRDYEVYEKSMKAVVELANKSRKFLDNRSCEESLLLAWLQYHYDEQCKQEWMDKKECTLNSSGINETVRRHNIQNFDVDLLDSVVLIAVTAAYCPFLIDEYCTHLYIAPRSYAETLHNAICIVNAWRRIRLGFMIKPSEIVHPNCVQMLMLVAHLFETLPTYIPRAKIKFCCPLTETVTRQVSFTNPTVFAVSYLSLLIGNDAEFFTILNLQKNLRLNGHDSAQLKIKYHARKIRKMKAYLLICGSAIGPNFGRNHTFILEGFADNLKITNDYIIQTKLYQIVESVLKINIPYDCATEYEIWMSYEQPTKPTTLKISRWSELSSRKIPRRLFLNQNTLIVAEGSKESQLSITVACITPTYRNFWLVFQSKHGDFIIQIISHWQPSITDRIVLQKSGDERQCICANIHSGDTSLECPLNITIPIPTRNTQFWNCVSYMFEKTLTAQERLFWARYLDTHIGLRLIHWLMGDTTDYAAMEFAHIFDTKVTYDIAISDKSSRIVVPSTITINDVRPSNETVPLIAHLPPMSSNLYETMLSLNSTCGKERRVYTISILRI